MCAAFGDDDVGKTVVNASGEEVGMVTAVEHGTARVTPDPGITDSIKAALGWEGTGEDTYPLQEDSVERVTGDEIRLSGDLHGEMAAGDSMDTDRESGRESERGGSDAGTGMGRTETPGDVPDDRTGRSDSTGLDDERTNRDPSGAIGDDESDVPDRDATSRIDESSGRGGPDDRPMDDSESSGSEYSDTDRTGREPGSSAGRSREEGEAMDPAVGDGDRTGGTDDELTDADRDVRDRDTDSDSDLRSTDSDSDSDTDRDRHDVDSDSDGDSHDRDSDSDNS